MRQPTSDTHNSTTRTLYRLDHTTHNMTSQTKLDVPKLHPSNYGPWLLALRAAAYNSDSFEHLTGDPQPPTDPVALPNFLKKRNHFLEKVNATIPSDIANLLIAPDSEPTPFALFTAIKAHLNASNASDHRYLKSLAEAAHFLLDMTLPDYITAHEKIRAKMIASWYPNISDPTITAEFMIEGLKHNPGTVNIGLQLLSIQPSDMKDFTPHFNRIQAYQDITAAIPQAHGLGAPTAPILRNPRYSSHPPQHCPDSTRKPHSLTFPQPVQIPPQQRCTQPSSYRKPMLRLSKSPQSSKPQSCTPVVRPRYTVHRLRYSNRPPSNMAATAPTEDNNDT